GWDADTPEELERSTRRLSLLAHRVVWVNPRAAAAGFEPSTGGMSTALPYCDRFLAGDTGEAMKDVIAAMTAAAR
ncbi:MAG: VWA domain-containing protein, partial [Acidimicrobiia bacterium]